MLIIASAVLLGGCGQMGPLYEPVPEENPAATPEEPAPPESAPAPSEPASTP